MPRWVLYLFRIRNSRNQNEEKEKKNHEFIDSIPNCNSRHRRSADRHCPTDFYAWAFTEQPGYQCGRPDLEVIAGARAYAKDNADTEAASYSSAETIGLAGYGSLKSPLCSCVSITLPASS